MSPSSSSLPVSTQPRSAGRPSQAVFPSSTAARRFRSGTGSDEPWPPSVFAAPVPQVLCEARAPGPFRSPLRAYGAVPWRAQRTKG